MKYIKTERFPARPYISEGYPHNQTVVVNGTAKMECKFFSDLEPYVQWLKTDTPSFSNDENQTTFANSTIVQVFIQMGSRLRFKVITAIEG